MHTPRMLALAVAWTTAVLYGSYVMIRYAATPGPLAPAASNWPKHADLARDTVRPTLVMFVHPHCPCSRASLTELATLLSRSKDRLAVRLVFIRPSVFEPGWEKSDLWSRAETLPVQLTVDPEGKIARAFGAQTSGDTFLYDAAGRLVFHGGITPGRGHEGANAGLDALESYVTTGRTEVDHCNVYGCPLLDP